MNFKKKEKEKGESFYDACGKNYFHFICGEKEQYFFFFLGAQIELSPNGKEKERERLDCTRTTGFYICAVRDHCTE